MKIFFQLWLRSFSKKGETSWLELIKVQMSNWNVRFFRLFMRYQFFKLFKMRMNSCMVQTQFYFQFKSCLFKIKWTSGSIFLFKSKISTFEFHKPPSASSFIHIFTYFITSSTQFWESPLEIILWPKKQVNSFS